MIDDPELEYARKFNLLLRRMRSDLTDAAVERLFRWACERNGINAFVASMGAVPDVRRRTTIAKEVQKQRDAA